MAKVLKRRASKATYTRPMQLELPGFESPFTTHLDPDNHWVKLSQQRSMETDLWDLPEANGQIRAISMAKPIRSIPMNLLLGFRVANLMKSPPVPQPASNTLMPSASYAANAGISGRKWLIKVSTMHKSSSMALMRKFNYVLDFRKLNLPQEYLVVGKT